MYNMNYLEYDCICEYLTSNIFINNIIHIAFLKAEFHCRDEASQKVVAALLNSLEVTKKLLGSYCLLWINKPSSPKIDARPKN